MTREELHRLIDICCDINDLHTNITVTTSVDNFYTDLGHITVFNGEEITDSFYVTQNQISPTDRNFNEAIEYLNELKKTAERQLKRSNHKRKD